MPAPLSADLRSRIVRARFDLGLNRKEIAKLFGVGEATVSRLLARHRRNESLEPKPHGGGVARAIDESVEVRLRQLLTAQPDATLQELADELGEELERTFSRHQVSRAVGRMGFTRKKRR